MPTKPKPRITERQMQKALRDLDAYFATPAETMTKEQASKGKEAGNVMKAWAAQYARDVREYRKSVKGR